MALRKQLVPVILSGGIDTKTEKKTVVKGNFLALENAVRRKGNEIRKRYGFSALSRDVIGSATDISSGKKLHKFNDDLLLLNNDNIFSYSEANDAWVNKGTLVSTLVEADSIVRNSAIQAMPDTCQSGGITVTVWEDSRTNQGVKATVVDDSTGAALLYDTLISDTGSRPKVVCVGNFFLITYIEGTDLQVTRIAIEEPSTLITEQTLYGDITDNPYDIVTYDQVAVVAYNNGAGGISVGYATQDGEPGNPASNGYPLVTTFSHPGTDAINIITDVVNEIHYVSFYDTGGAVADSLRILGITADLNTSSEDELEDISALSGAPDVRNITAVLRADDTVKVFYEINAASVKNYYVRTTTASWDVANPISPGTPEEFVRSVGLAAKAFTEGAQEYVTVTHESELQPTYFTINSDKEIVSKLQAGLGGGLTRDASRALKSGLPRADMDVNGDWFFPVQVRGKLEADNDGTILSSNVGLSKTTLKFEQAQFDGDQLGQNLSIAGGILLSYDGVSTVEHGFHLFPEDTSTAAAGSGGSLAAGDYLIQTLYEWVDGRGQVHRSAPSISEAITAAANDEFTVTIPTLRLTQKTGNRADVKVVAYITDTDGATVFYRAGQIDNVVTADTVDIVISSVDTTEEILYTVGGTVENIAPPASTVVHRHKNRLFLGGTEDGTIWYSREHVFGEGVFFSDLNVIKIDPTGGDVGSFDTLDDKLIIGKKEAFFALTGDGPTDAGSQNDFSPPELIAGDIGCDNPRSMARIPRGLIFQASNGKGIWMLDRTLTFRYIGAPVEDFNGETVTGVSVIPDAEEVRFTTQAGSTLVYNYYFEQWSTFTNYAAESCIVALNGDFLHLKSDGTVNREIEGLYEDNDTRITMAFETSWLSFVGLQGFQRVFRMAILGEFLSHHHLKMKLAYNFENTYNDTAYFTTTGVIGEQTYGSDAVYGASEVYGGYEGSRYQVRHKPRIQKCEAIKLRIEDVDTIAENGGGSFSFNALSFEIGFKTGIMRMSGARSMS